MREIGGEAVAEVDGGGGRGVCAEPGTLTEARLGIEMRLQHWHPGGWDLQAGVGLQGDGAIGHASQPGRRCAESPGDINGVAGLRAGTQEGFSAGNGADQDDVGEGCGGFRQIAAGKGDAGGFREAEQAVIEAGHPGCAGTAGVNQGGWQAKGDEGGEGARSHGCQVAQAAGQGTVADGLRGVPGEAEVAAVDAEVGSDGDVFAGAAAQQGAVIADAKGDGAARSSPAADLL